jgi:hypothetical protein
MKSPDESRIASFLSSVSIASLGLFATVDRWLMYHNDIASEQSVYAFAVMYTGLVGVMIMREYAQVRALQAAQLSLRMYEITVKAYESLVTDLSEKYLQAKGDAK